MSRHMDAAATRRADALCSRSIVRDDSKPTFPGAPDPGADVRVLVEVPRMGFVKRNARGMVDVVSPLPCPFNYGSVPGTRSGDGDPLDAVLLGPRIPRGVEVDTRVLGWVRFVDAGDPDPKLVCGLVLRPADRWAIRLFFEVYAPAKRGLALVRGRRGLTRFEGLVDFRVTPLV